MKADDVSNDSPPLVAASSPRARLVVQSGNNVDNVIQCRRVVTLIGSRDGCKVTLRHRRVAPVHAAIISNGTKVLAIDLNTRRGTYLNGLKLEYERLSDGDLLTIAPWEFRVDVAEVGKPDQDDAGHFDLEPSPHVIALEHLSTGRILRPERDVCIIGRRGGCDVTITDPRVSRVHALLLTYHGYPAIFDLLSKNMTLVNDRPVTFASLKDHDTLTIGDTRFCVRLLGSGISRASLKERATVQDKPDGGSQPVEGDLIDIAATERAKRWRIADSLENTTRRE